MEPALREELRRVVVEGDVAGREPFVEVVAVVVDGRVVPQHPQPAALGDEVPHAPPGLVAHVLVRACEHQHLLRVERGGNVLHHGAWPAEQPRVFRQHPEHPARRLAVALVIRLGEAHDPLVDEHQLRGRRTPPRRRRHHDQHRQGPGPGHHQPALPGPDLVPQGGPAGRAGFATPGFRRPAEVQDHVGHQLRQEHEPRIDDHRQPLQVLPQLPEPERVAELERPREARREIGLLQQQHRPQRVEQHRHQHETRAARHRHLRAIPTEHRQGQEQQEPAHVQVARPQMERLAGDPPQHPVACRRHRFQRRLAHGREQQQQMHERVGDNPEPQRPRHRCQHRPDRLVRQQQHQGLRHRRQAQPRARHHHHAQAQRQPSGWPRRPEAKRQRQQPVDHEQPQRRGHVPDQVENTPERQQIEESGHPTGNGSG